MSIAVELPSLGESVVEGTIEQWLVKPGDRVEQDQPLVEVTTDKVDAEIPSPVAGVIEKILVEAGETVPIGAKLVQIDASADGAVRPEPVAAGAASPPATGTPPPTDAPANGEAEVARATPVARRLADEARVDLGAVRGTGSAGRITKADVLRHAGSEPAPAEVARVPAARPAPPERAYARTPIEEGDRVIPMTPLRKLVAEHMVYSKRTSPHVGTVAEVDMNGVVRLRAEHKRRFQEANGFGLTFLPFLVNVTVRALREFPRLNASVTENAIIEKGAINIGIAVEAEKGLVVPVIRNADRLSLTGQAAAIEDLSRRARSRKLTADDLQGGTFTLSNPGRTGNLYGFAIINQPQVGILRMGEMVKRPVVRTVAGEDAIVIRPMMHVALSYDHRAVDGAPANAFLHRVRELLEAAEFDL